MFSHKFGFVSRGSVAFALALTVVSTPSFGRAIPIIPPDGVLTGSARIIDGDTIDIAGTRIRLEGIDAPEVGQTCQNAKAETWDCGNAATRVMLALTQGQEVKCQTSGLDKYGRILAVCFVSGVDINAEMVKRGYAWAFVKYSKLYVAEEEIARQAGHGIWQGPAIPAWDYRTGRFDLSYAVEPLVSKSRHERGPGNAMVLYGSGSCSSGLATGDETLRSAGPLGREVGSFLW